MNSRRVSIRYIGFVGAIGLLVLVLVFAKRSFLLLDNYLEDAAVERGGNAILSDSVIAELREGDIILRRGYGIVSSFVANQFNSGAFDISHSGVLTFRKGQWWVIHTLSSDVAEIDGVQVQSLSNFLKRSQPEKIIISRFKGLNAGASKAISGRARYYLRHKVPFDRKGIIDDTSELFCSEFIWTILAVDLNLLTLPDEYDLRKAFIYNMANLYSTRYFEIVVNQYRN